MMGDAQDAQAPKTLDADRTSWLHRALQPLRVYRGYANVGGIEGNIHWAAYLAAEIATAEEICDIFGYRLPPSAHSTTTLPPSWPPRGSERICAGSV